MNACPTKTRAKPLMSELFVNPWSAAIGAGLVAAPVVIHLINRMRYKRVRWAAMEFLLKAQKRMRRKMIVEQLLLLLLRCVLVLLLALLVGRFLGCSQFVGSETRTTSHLVILDDTPSMADGWRGEDGQPTDAFEQAKKVLVEQIAPAAAQATSPQTLDILRLSDLKDAPRSFDRINPASIDAAKHYLDGFRPGAVRVSVAAGLRKAKDVFAAQSGQDVGQVLHVLTDLRTADWSEDAEAIKQAAADLQAARVKVHFIDVAHPYRKDEKRPPLFHDNIGIVELKPSRLAVARFEPLEFTLRVRNFGASELKDVRFAVKVNGDDNKGRSVVVPTLPGNQERTVKFDLTFDRLGTDEKPLERFSLVTAALETAEPGGIAADNVRQAVVEVKDKLPILVVEGRPGVRDKKEGDGFYLKPIFTTVLGGFAWVNGSPQDLEKADLRNYACVFLLNVPALTEAAVQNLDRYVRNGGGVGFFLGPDVKPKDYNTLLYADGNGLFPVPLPEKPSALLTEEQRLARLFTLQKKLLLKDANAKLHPALSGIYTDERGQPIKDDDFEKFFSFVTVSQYWPVKRLGKWRDDRAVTELYCMPNEQSVADFEGPARKLADGLAVDDPAFAKFKEVLAPAREQLKRTAASSVPLYQLASLLDRLLGDQRGGDPDKSEALLREFWADPRAADLRREAVQLRDAVKYGDPLYVAKQVGRGRVAAVLTTAGEQWTDWPTGPGRPSFVPVVIEMERYLSGGRADENRLVGEPIGYRVEAARYKPTVGRAFLTHDPKAGARGTNPDPAPVVDLKEQTMVADGNDLVLNFTDNAIPGAYLFTFTNLKPQANGQAGETPEYRAAAANIDAVREGDLRRASRDDVLRAAAAAGVHSPADGGWLEALKNKKTDLSESAWLFAVLLLVLLAEQAMAVRLSHTGGADVLDRAAPSAAAAVHRHYGHHAGDPHAPAVSG